MKIVVQIELSGMGIWRSSPVEIPDAGSFVALKPDSFNVTRIRDGLDRGAELVIRVLRSPDK